MTVEDFIALAENTEPGKKSGNTILKPPVLAVYTPTGELVRVKAVSKHRDTMNRVLAEEFLDTDEWWREVSMFEIPSK